MKIVGYSDRFSVRPGQTIRFMVSSEAPAYRAQLVRLRHTDANPQGPGCKIEALASSISGEYRGRHQAIHSGSSAIVPHHPLWPGFYSVVRNPNGPLPSAIARFQRP